MTEARRFARLRATVPSGSFGYFAVPEDGLCLNAFVLLQPKGRSGEVLLGKLNPSAPWDHLGALDPERIRGIGDRWVLPASQLLLFESPRQAASRVVQEQLGVSKLAMKGPEVFSETYSRGATTERDPHWDIQFLFRANWGARAPPPGPAYREVAFVDPRKMFRRDFGRAHGDILELAGLGPRD